MNTILPPDYLWIKTLAKNKFSNSYLCRHKNNELFVAKELKSAPTQSQLEIIEKLNHITCTHLQKPQHHTFNNKHFIIRPYIDGKDLKTILKSTFLYNRLSKRFFIEAFIQIFKTLHLLHENGIYHADIKPANLLLSKSNSQWDSGNIFILDFERAIMKNQVQNNTPGDFALIYSPPEQILSYSHLYTNSIDIFATCICLLETLTNKKPLYDCNAEVLINLQLTYPIPKPGRMNETLFEIIKKGVYKERFPKPPNQLYRGEVTDILTKGIQNRTHNALSIANELEVWLQNNPDSKKKWTPRFIQNIIH